MCSFSSLLCSILRHAKEIIIYINLIYMPSKAWSNKCYIEFKCLCHTVYIRLLLPLFSETKSTLDCPIALASRYTDRPMHVGTQPETVLIHHLSLPITWGSASWTQLPFMLCRKERREMLLGLYLRCAQGADMLCSVAIAQTIFYSYAELQHRETMHQHDASAGWNFSSEFLFRWKKWK